MHIAPMPHRFSESIHPETAATVICLPDLQNYSGKGGEHFSVLEETMDWILSQKEKLQIDLVIQVGDLTDRDKLDEWNRVRQSFSKLDEKLPYIVNVGNHDLGHGSIAKNRDTYFNDYFKLAQNSLNTANCLAVFEEGKMENTVSIIKIAGTPWLIFALEFGPRDEVLEWANQIIAKHEGMRTWITTHEYMDELTFYKTGKYAPSMRHTYNSPYSYGIVHEQGSVNCGTDIWKKLLAPHPQIRGIVNGHYRPFYIDENDEIIDELGLAEAFLVTERNDGSLCEQMMFNAQWEERGGDGWMLILQFDNQGEYLGVRKFSPLV